MREWAYLAWIALADLAKYLDRGAVWEAHTQLHLVRDQIWRLWAAAHRLTFPQYGLVTVFDAPDLAPPEGIEGTVAGLDPDRLRSAGRRAAEVLTAVSRRAAGVVPVELPTGLADFARTRLATPGGGKQPHALA